MSPASAAVQPSRESWVAATTSTGAIALDTDAFTDASIEQRPRTMEAIVLHEIGHVVGLDHVSEPTELMAERNNGPGGARARRP